MGGAASSDNEDAAVGAEVMANGSDSTASDGASSSTAIDPLSDLYAVLEGSALVPFLESKLQANSFLEICSHTSVYRCVVNIIREIGEYALTDL